MTLLRFGFDMADTTTLTNGNTGGSLTVSGASLATASIDHPHWGTGAKWAAATAAQDLGRFTFNAANASAALECYIWFAASPTAQERLFSLRHAAGVIGRISISTAGKLVFENTGGTTVYTSTNTVTGLLYRIAFWGTVATSTTGTVHLAFYLGDSGTRVEAAFDASNVDLGTANFATVDVGRVSTGAQVVTVYTDSLQLDDGRTSEIGPYIIPRPRITNRVAVFRAPVW